MNKPKIVIRNTSYSEPLAKLVLATGIAKGHVPFDTKGDAIINSGKVTSFSVEEEFYQIGVFRGTDGKQRLVLWHMKVVDDGTKQGTPANKRFAEVDIAYAFEMAKQMPGIAV